MKLVPLAVSRKIAESGFLAKKHAPTILFGTGLTCMIGSTVLACRATLKIDAEIDQTERDIYYAKAIARDGSPHEDAITEEERQQDIARATGKGALRIARLYVPSVALGGVGVLCLTQSHKILQDRNLALMAAYSAVDGAFARYRARVVDTYGPQADREIMYETEEVEVIDEETGKLTREARIAGAPGSMYARFYAEWSTSNWSKDPDVNMLVLSQQQRWANDRLRARGHLFLNEVYDSLGLSHTQAGSIVGWRYNQDSGDDFVDFGIFEGTRQAHDFFVGHEDAILLDFNVDGVIYDKLDQTRNEMERTYEMIAYPDDGA